MQSTIIAKFIKCNLTDDELLTYLSKEEMAYVQDVFCSEQPNNRLLYRLIQEVIDQHKKIFLEIGNKPELHTGAVWNSVNKTIFIDHLRFGQNIKIIVNIIILELCNSVNSYMKNLAIFLDTDEKYRSHSESAALLYELAEHYSFKRYLCIVKEMLQNGSINSPSQVADRSRAMNIVQRKCKQGVMSTKYYWNSFNKRQENENAPHAHYYVNQLELTGAINQYIKLLSAVSRNILDDLLNQRFNQQQYDTYKSRVNHIYQRIRSVFKSKEEYCFLIADHICLFEMFNVLSEHEVVFYKNKLKTIVESFLSYDIFVLEINHLFLRIVKDRLYENNFAIFSSIPEEKKLITTFLNILYDLSFDDDSTMSDIIHKYDPILQHIKHHVPQLGEKYRLSLNYDLLDINQNIELQLRIQQDTLESKEIKELFCSYTYLKSWLTHRAEAELFKHQQTQQQMLLFSNIYNLGKLYVGDPDNNSHTSTVAQPSLGICWYGNNLTV